MDRRYTRFRERYSLLIHTAPGLTLQCKLIIIINPLTARVVGAPQMILQPVFSIFSLFSTALWDLPNSRPVHPCCLQLQACPFMLSSTPGLSIHVVFPPLPLSALSSPPFHCAFARWFWPDLMNGKHDHTTEVKAGQISKSPIAAADPH